MSLLTTTTRRSFLGCAATFAAIGEKSVRGEEKKPSLAQPEAPQQGTIRVRFLGSGASGWKPGWGKNPHMRRQSSILIEDKVLIDFTMCGFDKMPQGCLPEALFQTHSHHDHYNAVAAVKSGVKRFYVHESWASSARAEIVEAAAQCCLPAPEVIALKLGKRVAEGDLCITPVPASHATSRITDGVLEVPVVYLVEKGAARLLYATDTGPIPALAARMLGIDYHIRGKKYDPSNPFFAEPRALTAIIMEATSGDTDDDFRMFVHASVQMVSRFVNMLAKTKRFAPPPGHHVYLTHLGLKYRSWPSERINAELPAPLRAAYDGLEVVLG
jgi:hypothetical protein